MDSIGTINTSYIVEYDENCENYENLDNKFITKVKSSNLDDVIILFKEPNFEKLFREASKCFIVCVELDNMNEEEETDEKVIAIQFNTAFEKCGDDDEERLIIIQFNKNLWMRNRMETNFKKIRNTNFENFLHRINFGVDILCSNLQFSTVLEFINTTTHDLILKILKLFTFNDQFLNEILKVVIRFAIPIDISRNILQLFLTQYPNYRDLTYHQIIAIILEECSKNHDAENWINIKNKLSDDDVERVTDETAKCHGKPLLAKLFSRCSPAFGQNFTKAEDLRVNKMFTKIRKLNHGSVNPLLESIDDKLDITFDFNSDTIERSYPAGDDGNVGIFDPKRMIIFVGAKNFHNISSKKYQIREWEIMGILIHEICHYVCYTIFNNNCLPYRKDDNIREYEEIIKDYKSLTNHHEIVGRVFSKKYNETMWHAELIVRVVQMIVTYKVLDPNNLKRLEKKYEGLFSYFNNRIIPQIEKYIDPDNELRRQIMKVSSFRLDQFELKPVRKPLNYNEDNCIHFVETNSPMVAMANFCSNLHDDYAIFTSFTDLMDEFKGREIFSLWGKYSKINIVIYCDQIDIKCESFEGCLDKLNSNIRTNQIFLIIKEHSQHIDILRKKLTKDFENLEIWNFNFSDLTEESKEIILQKTAIFQGSQTTLNKIITKDSKAAQFLPINHSLESSELIVIGKLPEKNDDYDDKIFIQRKLSKKINEQVMEFSTEKMEDILTLLSTRQYIIISDEVGKGKSTLMTHLAYQFLQSSPPHIEGKFFIVKISLHQHAKLLENFKGKTLLNRFIFDNFVSCSEFKEFEWAIFEEYFKNGKLILMLDGFDEISPTCENQTLSIIQKALNSNFSNVIVATRPHILNTLGSIVDSSKTVILNLTPIFTSDQINFLTNHFKTQNKVAKKFSEAEFDKLIKNIMQKLFTSVRENIEDYIHGKFLLSSPLHLKMFAEVISEKIFKNKNSFKDVINRIVSLNMYQIYDEFFYIKSDIAEEEKGDVVKREIKNMERRGSNRLNFYNCARKLAWNTLHPAFKANPLEIDEREKKFLQYYGLVTIQNDEVCFIHRSYAEFFIAHLFIEELDKKNFSSTSNFANENFLVNILTVNDYETIKGFIDTALSDKDLYDTISSDSFKCLGKFIINEFKKLEGNDKNFLHCVMFHELKERMRRVPRKDFVFVSHLMIQSLIYCNDKEDVDAIKHILQLPWDINSKH